MTSPVQPRLLTASEVAALFRVQPKTVNRWGDAGRLEFIRTPSGHRRHPEPPVRALLEAKNPPWRASKP